MGFRKNYWLVGKKRLTDYYRPEGERFCPYMSQGGLRRVIYRLMEGIQYGFALTLLMISLSNEVYFSYPPSYPTPISCMAAGERFVRKELEFPFQRKMTDSLN